jgi:hypothetical protein
MLTTFVTSLVHQYKFGLTIDTTRSVTFRYGTALLGEDMHGVVQTRSGF